MMLRGLFSRSNSTYQQLMSGKTFNFQPFVALSSFSSEERITCQCGQVLPETSKLVEIFKSRRLREIRNEVDCPYFKSFQFIQANDCELVSAIEDISVSILKDFQDVERIGSSRLVLLESLNEVPEGDLGDLTGDHGKQLIKFIQDCFNNHLIGDFGSVLDIGGQNTSLVNLISKYANNQDLPCLIVDINAITPAISPEQKNIKYIIEDGRTFFSSDNYDEYISEIIDEKPSLFIMNNLLNLLRANEGWEILESAWNKLRVGDYLIISGLVPEQFERLGFKEGYVEDGIVEFHHKNKGFYKSALSASFFECLTDRLASSEVLFEETFKFTIEARPKHLMEVKGRRLLSLKKTA